MRWELVAAQCAADAAVPNARECGSNNLQVLQVGSAGSEGLQVAGVDAGSEKVSLHTWDQQRLAVDGVEFAAPVAVVADPPVVAAG